MFVDFVGSTAGRVTWGELAEAVGGSAISNLAAQQFQSVQAERALQAAQQAQQQAANAALGIALLQQAHAQPEPMPQMVPMMPIGSHVNMACGLAPLPRIGCRVGACVCDASGQSCNYQMVCN